VELANRESLASWKDFCLELKKCGLLGVELVISDDHAGPRKAIVEVLPEAAGSVAMCIFLRNALEYCHAMIAPDGLRWIYDRRSIEEARQDLAA
jgi:putative transposase